MRIADVILQLWPAAEAGWPAAMELSAGLAECSTVDRAAMYIAQTGHECAGFTRFTENLNYSAEGLAKTWKYRYAVDPRAAVKVPNALANALAKNPQAIANNCYARRNGNGDEASGDGWKFRGRGPIQITGHDNYAACAKWLNLDLLSFPDMLVHPDAGSRSAAWFWVSRRINDAADARDVRMATKLVNGGEVGLAEREDVFYRVRRALAA